MIKLRVGGITTKPDVKPTKLHVNGPLLSSLFACGSFLWTTIAKLLSITVSMQEPPYV